MQDRVSRNPGRVLITPEDGSTPFYAIMTRADNPEVEGTKINKNALLKDATAALFGLGTDAVPDDIYLAVKAALDEFTSALAVAPQIATGSYTGKNKAGSSNKNSLTFDFEPKVVIISNMHSKTFTLPVPTMAIMIHGATATMALNYTSSGYTARELVVAWSGNKVTWYANGATYGQEQLDGQGETYHYVAIG